MKLISKKAVFTTLFVVGLLLSGSDGNLFPWINFMGLWMLSKAMRLANKWCNNDYDNYDWVGHYSDPVNWRNTYPKGKHIPF